MFLKVGIVIFLLIAAFMIYVAFLPGGYEVSRSVEIKAAPSAIFPYLNDLRKAESWNPFTKVDPSVTVSFGEPVAGVGASYSWAGNNQVGAGQITITESVPDQMVALRLNYERPFRGVNTAKYSLHPGAAGTGITWALRGEASFVPKMLMALRVINMDRMIGGSFEKGLSDLKARVEGEAIR